MDERGRVLLITLPDVGGHDAAPIYKQGQFDTIGDGHGQWQWVNQVKERGHAWSVMRPYAYYYDRAPSVAPVSIV